MLSGIVTLLLFTVIGNLLSDGLRLPVPGAVIGLILLVAYIQLKGEIDEPLDKVSQFCIRYLAALFLPGLVGVFFMGDLLAKPLNTERQRKKRGWSEISDPDISPAG